MRWFRQLSTAAVWCALAFAGVVAISGDARAEVKIDPACRMVNRPPGRCGWCAVETLARHHGIEALYGLVEKHASDCSAEDLTEVLDKAGVSYRLQWAGTNDTAILGQGCRDGLGVAVGLRPPRAGAAGHIVTVVDFGEEIVKVIDPNDRDRRVRALSRDKFLRSWDGFAVVLQPAQAGK